MKKITTNIAETKITKYQSQEIVLVIYAMSLHPPHHFHFQYPFKYPYQESNKILSVMMSK